MAIKAKVLREYFDNYLQENPETEISWRTFRARVLSGMDWNKAISKPVRGYGRKNLEYNGKLYAPRELYEKYCKVKGLTLMGFRNRIYVYGFSVEEALTNPLNQHRDDGSTR